MISARKPLAGAAFAVAMIALPAFATAQGGRGPGMGPPPGPNPVSSLIDMRRQLDLTPRQVAALDSIERSLAQRNGAVLQRLQSRRDSLVPNRERRGLTPDERTALRARLDSLAPLRAQIQRNDSTAGAAAFRVLTDSQRARVSEMQAAQRGFAMGRAMGRRGGGGPMAQRRGAMMRGRQGRFGGGGRMGAPGIRGRMMPRRPFEMGPPMNWMGPGPGRGMRQRMTPGQNGGMAPGMMPGMGPGQNGGMAPGGGMRPFRGQAPGGGMRPFRGQAPGPDGRMGPPGAGVGPMPRMNRRMVRPQPPDSAARPRVPGDSVPPPPPPRRRPPSDQPR